MAPIGTLTGFVGNSRVRRARAAAALAGVEIEFDENARFMGRDWKTPEFLAKFPLGTLPVFETTDGFCFGESGAIADFLAAAGPNSTLIPSDAKDLALARQWQYFADQELFIKHSVASQILGGKMLPYNKAIFDGLVNTLTAKLEILNGVLADKTFLVGERITIADIFIATALTNLFTGLIDASIRAKVPNVVRYTETVIKNPKIAHIFDNGNVEFIEKQPAYVPPAKAEKPKEAAKSKEAAAPKAKKEQKKDDDDEFDEPLVSEEPKAKNPLDDLPKSAFNLEEWKRQYSNLDTRKEAIPWFYEKFDHEGFSIWRVDFKYNDELTQVFMSSNQIGGFFNRLEASRKYLFGSVGVLGKANDSIITGVLILRGKDVKPVVDVAPDWESYEYKQVDLANQADKDFFEAALAWDLVVDGKEWADGKNFK
ncbi:hypothetical protein Q5752_005180 [Cryptotrichosporon argae]